MFDPAIFARELAASKKAIEAALHDVEWFCDRSNRAKLQSSVDTLTMQLQTLGAPATTQAAEKLSFMVEVNHTGIVYAEVLDEQRRVVCSLLENERPSLSLAGVVS